MEIIGSAALLLYATLLVIIGVVLARGQTPKDFAIGSKHLSAFASATTIFASKIGAGLILTYSVLVFTYGIWAISLFVGFVFEYFIFYFFAAKLFSATRDNDIIGMSGFYRKVFADSISGRLIGFVAALSMFGWVLTNLIGGAKLLSDVSEMSFIWSLVFIAVTVGIYIGASGFLAVVRTDTVQAIAMVAIFLGMAFYLATSSGTSSRFIPARMPVQEVILFFITGALFPLGSAELWERVIATRDLKSLRNSLISASIAYVVFGLLLAWVCLEIAGAGPIENRDIALIDGLAKALPPYLRVLALVAFASAVLSSADTFIYSTASLATQSYLDERLTLKDRVPWIRGLMIPTIVIGVLGAWALRDILDVTFIFASITIVLGSIAIVYWIKPSISGRALATGAVAGTCAILISAMFLGASPMLAAVGLVVMLVFSMLATFCIKMLSEKINS